MILDFFVAASAPKLKVADCDFNTNEIKSVIEKALKEDVQIICFPELSITSYSCGDLFSGSTSAKGFNIVDRFI